MLNYLKAGPRKYEPANRTLYFLLANLFALNLKNTSTWEKKACNFFWLPSKTFGGLTFKGLTMASVTTYNDCGAAGA